MNTAVSAQSARGAPCSVVDTHVHIWDRRAPWMSWLAQRPSSWDPVRDDFSWHRLRAELDQAQVEELVLVQAATSLEETCTLLSFAEHEPSVIGVVGWVSMATPKVTERDLATLQKAGSKLVGVRALHRWEPDGEVFAVATVAESCRLLADHGIPVDLFVNDHTELGLLPPIVGSVPHGRFVVDHLGRPPIDQDATAQRLWAEAMKRLGSMPNVFVKFSGWGTVVQRTTANDVARYRDLVLEVFGPERTMYASNWPVSLVADDYASTYAATRQALRDLAPAELAAVLGETARTCYRRPQSAERQV